MKDQINGGGPAFPCYEIEVEKQHFGLSLRDWFAGQALAGMCAGFVKGDYHGWTSLVQMEGGFEMSATLRTDMKTQIEKLKTELREFIELSKTITPGKWRQTKDNSYPVAINGVIFGGDCVSPFNSQADATFIVRSRNISPTMAECLLESTDTLETLHKMAEEHNAEGMALLLAERIQQILTLWEASK